MNKVLYIILISIFSFTVISCSEKDESTSTTTSTLDPPTTATATGGYYQVELDWSDVSGATGYTIYWSTSTGVSSSSTAITGITDSNYTHTGLVVFSVKPINRLTTYIIKDRPEDSIIIITVCLIKYRTFG